MKSPTAQQNGVLSRAYSTLVLIALVVSLPPLAWGLVGALRTNSNDPRQWLPRGFEETRRYDWLQQHFGNDEVTIVSWPNCTIQDERAESLARALTVHPDTAYFERAVTGQQILRRMIAPPLRVPPREALRRLQGTLIGPDGRSTCVMLTVSPRGVDDRAGAIEHLQSVAQHTCGLDPEQLRLGGPTVDAATIDVESQRMLLELAGLSGLVAMTITWLRLRSVRLSLIILVVAVYCTALAMAILYYTGGTMNLVMTMLPPLIFVLSVSSSIHLVNYYDDALAETSWQTAPLWALRHGWKPCVLASGTTGLGLLSLAVSEIVPVKMFGIYAASGMFVGLGVILVLLPVALQVWPAKVPARRADRSGQADGGAPPGGLARQGEPRIDRLFETIQRRHSVVTTGFAVLMAATGVGLFALRSTVKLQYRFGAQSRILRDYRWLEEHLGPLVPLELVVHFDAARPRTLADQLQQVDLLERRVRQLPDVGAALSGADFAPVFPGGSSLRDVTERVVWNRRAEQIEAQLDHSGFFAQNEQGEPLWRISIRASALGDIDYGRFVDSLREKVDPYLSTRDGIQVTYTGVIPLIYKAQRELLSDLTKSFLLAFCLIAVVIMIALRSIRSGLVAMLPNVFPVVVIFGLMGWLGVWIEIGSIMTASAAMGIAVDDTFHLLVWHRRGLRDELPQIDAVRYALHRCAGAMVHTTLICASSLLVFSLSSFMPIVRFAWLMAALLCAALVGDLVLLPAILVGPLGRVFRVDQRCDDSPRQPSSLGSLRSKRYMIWL